MVLSEGTFTSVSIDKKLKRSLKNSRNKGFLTFFASEFLNWEATTGGHYVSLFLSNVDSYCYQQVQPARVHLNIYGTVRGV